MELKEAVPHSSRQHDLVVVSGVVDSTAERKNGRAWLCRFVLFAWKQRSLTQHLKRRQ